MDSWTLQTSIGLIGGGALFLVALVPLLVRQYRRYGRLSAARVLGSAAVCVYGVAVVAYTLLPLPPISEACGGRTGPNLQLVPFAFVGDIAGEAAKVGLGRGLASWAMLQVVFNIALFAPLGLLARGVGKATVAQATLAGLGVSLLVELTQLTGDWGLYPCGYRVADVDDLLANTLGALLGALAASRALGWMPSSRSLEEGRVSQVSGLRRLIGMALDAGIFFGVQMAAFAVLMGGAVLLAMGEGEPAAGSAPGQLTAAAAFATLLATTVVVILPALRGSGASLGQRLVSLEPRWQGGSPTASRRLLRAGIGTGAIALAQAATFALSTPVLDGLASAGIAAGVVEVPAELLVLGLWGWLAACAASALVGDHRGLSGRIAGCAMADAAPSLRGATAAADPTPAALEPAVRARLEP